MQSKHLPQGGTLTDPSSTLSSSHSKSHQNSVQTLVDMVEINQNDKNHERGKSVDERLRKHLQAYPVVKRTGMLVPFREDRILAALEAAFRDTKKIARTEPLTQEIHQEIQHIAHVIIDEIAQLASKGSCITVEGIQDIVEVKLMETGHHDVARDYIVYRDQHKTLREDSPRNLKVLRWDGVSLVRFNPMKIASAIEKAFCASMKIEGTTPENVITAVNLLTNKVVDQSVIAAKAGKSLNTEMIQDEIERQLMRELQKEKELLQKPPQQLL
jgi:ribonucleoside-diphosphate reductase alpha chain